MGTNMLDGHGPSTGDKVRVTKVCADGRIEVSRGEITVMLTQTTPAQCFVKNLDKPGPWMRGEFSLPKNGVLVTEARS